MEHHGKLFECLLLYRRSPCVFLAGISVSDQATSTRLPRSTTRANYPLADLISVCEKWRVRSHTPNFTPSRAKMKKLMCLLLLALPMNIPAQDQKPISTATI